MLTFPFSLQVHSLLSLGCLVVLQSYVSSKFEKVVVFKFGPHLLGKTVVLVCCTPSWATEEWVLV